MASLSDISPATEERAIAELIRGIYQAFADGDVHHRVCAGLVRELVEELERVP